MKIMGVDASTSSTGWSLFVDVELKDYGVIKGVGSGWREKLYSQTDTFLEIIRKYKPSLVVMEDVPLKKSNTQALVILGATQGLYYGMLRPVAQEIRFVNPSEWRAAIGIFDGTKEGMKRDILKKHSVEKANKLFQLDLRYVSPSSKFNEDDISDAILIAYSQIIQKIFEE